MSHVLSQTFAQSSLLDDGVQLCQLYQIMKSQFQFPEALAAAVGKSRKANVRS